VDNFEVWFKNDQPKSEKDVDTSRLYIRSIKPNITIEWMYDWILRIVRDHKIFKSNHDYPRAHVSTHTPFF
jgi:hypothetical protein